MPARRPRPPRSIFHYDDDFPVNSGKGFKESDKPNFTGSYYSHTKVGAAGGGSWVAVWHGAAEGGFKGNSNP